jgi:hypothetical protein
MSALSRRSLVTSAAALPALAVPAVAVAACAEPDPIYAAIEACLEAERRTYAEACRGLRKPAIVSEKNLEERSLTHSPRPFAKALPSRDLRSSCSLPPNCRSPNRCDVQHTRHGHGGNSRYAGSSGQCNFL